MSRLRLLCANFEPSHPATMAPIGPIQRILIIRPSALGDVCRTVPVLVSLRAAYPEAEIDWVVQDDFAAAVETHPALNRVISFPRSKLAGWWRSPGSFMAMLGWFNRLRRHRYDLVFDGQGLGRSGLMALATRARQRIGLRSAREFAWLAYTQRAPAEGVPMPVHTVDQMLSLLAAADVPVVADMTLYVNPEQREWWRSRRASEGWPRGKYAVLAPTSRWLSKRWPIDRWVHLIAPLRDRGFEKIVVIGSPSEQEQVRQLFVQNKPGVRGMVDLVGQTSIAQTMAVIAEADLVIANDSAPLHMAVGFNRDIVALFGPTDPAEVGPYGREDSVIRGYCPSLGETINFKNSKLGDSLMRFISTATVLQKVDQVMAAAARREATWIPKLVAGETAPEPKSEPRPRREATS